ncbi:ATP-binding cassette [Mactra antiquata]
MIIHPNGYDKSEIDYFFKHGDSNFVDCEKEILAMASKVSDHLPIVTRNPAKLNLSGKSTIAALIERFYEIDSGNEPVLFATSVLENMRYGRPDATDTEVYEAVTLTNAHDFIVGFPEGYNTILGERGVTVSEGQKHGIAIARALIKNPSILILDEATSMFFQFQHFQMQSCNRLNRNSSFFLVIYNHMLHTDRGCCGRQSIKNYFNNWPSLHIKLDSWHFMRHFPNGCSTDKHQLYAPFMAKLSSCIFKVDTNDYALLKRAKKEEIK